MFNKVIVLGNLTRAIELQYLQNGTALGKSAIAVNNNYKNSAGAEVKETMYIDCTFWGRTAENANKYLKSGSKLLLEGSLVFEQWVDAQGGKRSKHSLKVQRMEMLDSKPQMAAPTQGGVYPPIQQPNPPVQSVQSSQPVQQFPHTGMIQETTTTYAANQPIVPAAQVQQQNTPIYDIDDDEIPF